MRHDVETALDKCLEWLRGGSSIEDCTARYPEYADELRPLLLLVADVGRVLTPPSSAAARAAGRDRMLSAQAQTRQRQARVQPVIRYLRQWRWVSPRPAWGLAIMALAVLLFAAGGAAVNASTESLPGDALYPLKLARQKAQLALSRDPTRLELLEERFHAQQRLDVEAVLKGGRQVMVEFQGELQQQEGNLWTVGGLPVTVRDSTDIVGLPRLGATVHVRGDLPGSGILLAVSLDVERDTMPEPTLTPEPSDTVQAETPEPAQTPVATETPEPTKTPTPVETPGASEAEETEAPKATDTEQAEDEAELSETAGPTDTAEPTEAIEPTDALEPGDTPEPPEPAEATEVPEPDESPDDEATPGPSEPPDPEDAPEDEDTSEEPVEPPDSIPEQGGTSGPTEPAEEADTPGDDGTPEPDEPAEDDDTPERDESPEPTEPPEEGKGPGSGGAPEATGAPDDAPGQGATPGERETSDED